MVHWVFTLKTCEILYFIIDQIQANIYIDGLKKILEDQDNINDHLQAENQQLKTQNLSDLSIKLKEKLNQLEKESSEKITKFFNFFFIFKR